MRTLGTNVIIVTRTRMFETLMLHTLFYEPSRIDSMNWTVPLYAVPLKFSFKVRGFGAVTMWFRRAGLGASGEHLLSGAGIDLRFCREGCEICQWMILPPPPLFFFFFFSLPTSAIPYLPFVAPYTSHLFQQITYLRNKKHMLTCQGGTGCYRF